MDSPPANAATMRAQSPWFWVSGYCTKWRIQGSSHCSSRLAKKSSMLSLETYWQVSSRHLPQQKLCKRNKQSKRGVTSSTYFLGVTCDGVLTDLTGLTHSLRLTLVPPPQDLLHTDQSVQGPQDPGFSPNHWNRKWRLEDTLVSITMQS